jgi:hypothetical protein
VILPISDFQVARIIVVNHQTQHMLGF